MIHQVALWRIFIYLALQIYKYRKIGYLLLKNLTQTGVLLHMHAKMAMQRWKTSACCLLRESRVCLTSLLVPYLCELWSPGFFWIKQVVVMLSSDLQVVNWHQLKESPWIFFPFFRILMLLTFIDLGIQSLLPAAVKRWVTLLALQNACSLYFWRSSCASLQARGGLPLLWQWCKFKVVPWKLYFCLKDLFRPLSSLLFFFWLKNEQKKVMFVLSSLSYFSLIHSVARRLSVQLFIGFLMFHQLCFK